LTLSGLRKYFVRNAYFYLIVFFAVFAVIDLLSTMHPVNWIVLVYLMIFIVMFVGQLFLATPFGHLISYYFYLVSIVVGMGIALFLWFSQNSHNFPIYVVVWALLTTAFAISHFLTSKKAGIPPFTGVFSFFLFVLLFVFSIPKNFSPSAYDLLFFLTLALFIINGIFCSNQLFRATVLKKELGFSNRESFVDKTKDELLGKPNVLESDVDLLVYYLKSSLDAFVQGDLERSFMDAFKIAFDNQGKPFEGIYRLPEDVGRQQHYADIRDCLSHAKHTPKDKDEQQKERLKRIKEVKKNLYKETLKLLRVVKIEFIDAAIKK